MSERLIQNRDADLWWLVVVVVVAVSTAASSGCGGPSLTEVQADDGPASADGVMRVVETPRGNRQVELALDDMPPPERYRPGLSTFAIWIVPPAGAPIYVGELTYDRDSEVAVGTAITPHRDFHLLVTVEPEERSAIPSDVVVLEEDVSS